MKAISTITLLFFVSVAMMAQNNANLYIENPNVNGSKFSWEVHITPTNTWSFPQSLGDCSWYFNYNSAGLSNPVLTYIAPELSTAVYSNTTGLTGGKVQITTDISIAPPDFGTLLSTSTKYHIYTVEMDITNASLQSLIEWDQTNTGIFTGLDGPVVESYFGNGNTPLPVELTSFAAKMYDIGKVKLNWATQTEVNNYGFDVERQAINGQWEKVGFVNGNGNSNSPKDYSFIDKNLIGGSKFLYRLKQVDNDGQFEYSSTVEVEVVPTQFELSQNYPNPFNPTTKIRYQLPIKSQVVIKIYNILGSEVIELVNEQKEAGSYEADFNASNLPAGRQGLSSGTYIYKISANNFVQTKKMILLK